MSWEMPGINIGPPIHERPDPPQNAAAEDYWPLPRQDRAQIPVIAHLVWPDREEWRATTARRWIAELVWVTWPPTATERGGGAWLKLEDVTRVVVKERGDSEAPDKCRGPASGIAYVAARSETRSRRVYVTVTKQSIDS